MALLRSQVRALATPVEREPLRAFCLSGCRAPSLNVRACAERPLHLMLQFVWGLHRQSATDFYGFFCLAPI